MNYFKKEITMDYERYKKEKNQVFEKGLLKGMRDVLNFLQKKYPLDKELIDETRKFIDVNYLGEEVD